MGVILPKFLIMSTALLNIEKCNYLCFNYLETLLIILYDICHAVDPIDYQHFSLNSFI